MATGMSVGDGRGLGVGAIAAVGVSRGGGSGVAEAMTDGEAVTTSVIAVAVSDEAKVKRATGVDEAVASSGSFD